MDQSPLDNPVWSALTTSHAGWAIGTGAARRYPPEVTPMAGMAAADAAGYAALRGLVAPGGIIPLFLGTPEPPPFPVMYARDIAQMTLERGLPAPEPGVARRLQRLGATDAPEMLALVELTKPGPFGTRTVELGDYFGIREGGVLVAMAGTRLRPAGAREISGVCVHPLWRGRGYGKAVTRAVAACVAEAGEIAFLHVKTDNDSARRAYLGLGFSDRRTIHLRVLKMPESGG